MWKEIVSLVEADPLCSCANRLHDLTEPVPLRAAVVCSEGVELTGRVTGLPEGTDVFQEWKQALL